MVGIRSSKEIYAVLEKHLRAAPYAMTCVNLMDIAEVRQVALETYGNDHTVATNKVSDNLGFMWRRGLLTRFPAPKNGGSLAKYAYIWDKKEDARPTKPIPSPISKKQGIVLNEHENGAIEIEFDKFFVLITPKR